MNKNNIIYTPTETYSKPPKTFAEQVSILESRGMAVADRRFAEELLQETGYYRLSAYMLPFKQRNANDEIIDLFQPGTTIEKVHNLYQFDNDLRLLVFSAIECIEVSLRSQIVYQLSHKYGSHWQDNPSVFSHKLPRVDIFNELQSHIADQMARSTEVFINHYKSKYITPANPPSWMIIETTYFRHLSLICANLAKRADLVDIALYYDLPPAEFCSWLHGINSVRNVCAHHGRLWNRDIGTAPRVLRFSKNRKWLANPGAEHTDRLYYTLCTINYFLQTLKLADDFVCNVQNLLSQYPDIPLAPMGFTNDWRNETIWK